jgi:hypothetical protein
MHPNAMLVLTVRSKYGTAHRQIRALVVLDGLIQNAGGRFQKTFADEPLLERLRLMARDDTVDPIVREKCKVMFLQWANAYQKTPGLERIANLYKEFPKTKRPAPAAAREKVLRDTSMADPDADMNETSSPGTRSRSNSKPKPPVPGPASKPVTLNQTSAGFPHKLFKDKKSHGTAGKPFSLSKEKDNMTNAIAKTSIATTNLMNGLQLINRETERVSDNPEIIRRVDACKSLRRKILYYIQHVESDEWIGSLVNANDELVDALTAYHIMDRSISDDSDSDAWESMPDQGSSASKGVSAQTQNQLAGLSLEDKAPPKPPRPAAPTIAMPPPPVPAATQSKASDDEEEDDDDPFGDSNAVQTPFNERPGMTWKEV